jgi:thymidylate synthase
MRSIICQTPNIAYPSMIELTRGFGNEVPSRLDTTLEVRGMVAEIIDPRNRLVTSWSRPVNVAFALAEVLWILGGRQDVEMLEFYNSQISKYSDDGVRFNAPYGARLRHTYGHDQLEDVIRSLRDNPDSRQGTLVITCPAFDRNYEPNGEKRETQDRACNLISHLLVRDGALHWLQVIRSNDALWGTPYNWMQFMHLQEYCASNIGVEIGTFTHVAHSFHIYGYHFEEAAQIKPFDLYQELGAVHATMGPTSLKDIKEMLEAEELQRQGGEPNLFTFGHYWQDVFWILAAHREYRAGNDGHAYDLLKQSDPILAAAQTRFYWDKRWHKTADTWQHLLKADWPPSVIQWITGGNDGPQDEEVAKG